VYCIYFPYQQKQCGCKLCVSVFIFQCREKYLIKFGSPCLTQPPKGYSVRYTYPNGKHESVGVESVKRDELIVSSSPSNLKYP